MKTQYKFCLIILVMYFLSSGFLYSESDSIMTLEANGSFNLSGIDYSPDGKRIAAGYSLRIIIWDTEKGYPIDTIQTIGFANRTIRYSYDGSMIVSSGDSTPRLLDANTGELLKIFQGKPEIFDYRMIDVSFSHDDTKIVGGSSDSTVAIWDVNTGNLVRRFKAHDDIVAGVAFSRDDSKIISCSYNTIKIWDSNTYELLKTLEGHIGWVLNLAISPDGLKIASCGYDSTIKLWDINTGELIRTYIGHKNKVASVVFSPNGTKILSGGYDKTVKLWDVASGVLLHTFVGHKTGVFYVRYSPDSLKLASAGNFEKIIIWKVPEILGVNDESIYNNHKNGINISPNPATDFIEISVPVGARHTLPEEIRIYNVFGQEVNPTPALPKGRGFASPPLGEGLGGVLKIDVSTLPPGVYFVRVGGRVGKFMKI